MDLEILKTDYRVGLSEEQFEALQVLELHEAVLPKMESAGASDIDFDIEEFGPNVFFKADPSKVRAILAAVAELIGSEEAVPELPQSSSPSYGPFVAPFHYEPHGACVFDNQGHRIFDLRGWGYLTGKGSGGLGLNADTANGIHNKIGEHLAALMNQDAGVSQIK